MPTHAQDTSSVKRDSIKVCTKCLIPKQASEFYVRKAAPRAGQLFSLCKMCFKKRGREYYRTLTDSQSKQWKANTEHRKAFTLALVLIAKDRPCLDCGVKYEPCQMDFDHRDPSTKIDSVASLTGDGGMTKILLEIAKCDLVCANCHRLRTQRQRSSKRLSRAIAILHKDRKELEAWWTEQVPSLSL